MKTHKDLLPSMNGIVPQDFTTKPPSALYEERDGSIYQGPPQENL